MADKQVQVKVATDVELAKVKSLEDTIRELRQQKLRLDIDANTQKLQETETRIQGLKTFLDTVNTGNTNINIDDSQIKKAQEELDALESEKIDLEIAVETGKLESVKAEIEDLDDTEIDVNLDNTTALQAVDQISQGFDRLKQGVMEVKDVFSDLLSSAGSQEMNKTFLEMNLGANGAKSALQDINSIVATLPGDDTALQGLLSQAAAKNAGITRQELEGMAVAATDYFSAMSFYGKSAVEAQQDMTNYILSGNTAELERSPILQGHIDKLKEGTTIQERSKLLQEALNAEGWGGISQQDTYNNKLETFNGMLERGKYNLGGMFQEGAKAGMDFLLKLDEATNGAVGMGIALGGLASPLVDIVSGFGQMAVGMKAIKDLGMIKWLKELELMTKLSAAADWILAGAQAALNFVMSLNPIILVAIALAALVAVLIWAYYNVDWFRESVDSLSSTLQWIVGIISGDVMGAFNDFTESIGLSTDSWIDKILGFILFIPMLPATLALALGDALAQFLGFTGGLEEMVNTTLNNLWTYITTLGGMIPQSVSITGNQVIDSVLKVMAFMATLPLQLAVIFTNILAKALGFGNNFVQNMLNAGSRAVSNFINQIKRGPSQLAAELQSMINQALSFSGQIGSILWQAGVNAVMGFINGLQRHSPGKMQREFVAEITEMGERVPEESKLMIDNVYQAGKNVTDAFNPSLNDIDFGNVEGVNGRSSAGVGGDLIVNIYGDVDTEERAKFIIETFRKEIAWDNTTAGRTN